MGVAIAIVNQKGGVGKTTTAINLSACLAELGKRVLLVDTDPQGNATSGMGLPRQAARPQLYDVLAGFVEPHSAIKRTRFTRLDIIPSDIDLAGAEIELSQLEEREYMVHRALQPVLPDYDFIILDAPPSLGLLTVNCLTAAHYIIIPIQCEYYALEGLGNLLSTIRKVRMSLNPSMTVLGILRTMFDTRTNLAAQVSEEVERHFPNWVLRSIIPRTVRLSEAPSHGLPIIYYDSRNVASAAYRQLAREVLERLGEPVMEEEAVASSEVSEPVTSVTTPNETIADEPTATPTPPQEADKPGEIASTSETKLDEDD
ncbi:MAG TPA: ParA family protein [Armatimonadetes bacterium]|nr:ParA family protein [Armatimonadota bacterium]